MEEDAALKSLLEFLQKYTNCVILGVDEDTVAILMKKLNIVDREKVTVVGFTYWKRVLKYLDVNDYKSVDLEEYYGKLNQEELSSVTTAVKVAKVLRNSVKEVTCKRKGGKKSMHSDFYKLCKKIEFLSEPKNVECEKKETDVEYVEVYNSFRPSVSAAISAKRLEQIEVLSESENEHEVAVECKTEIVGGPVRVRGPTATLWVSRIT